MAAISQEPDHKAHILKFTPPTPPHTLKLLYSLQAAAASQTADLSQKPANQMSSKAETTF